MVHHKVVLPCSVFLCFLFLSEVLLWLLGKAFHLVLVTFNYEYGISSILMGVIISFCASSSLKCLCPSTWSISGISILKSATLISDYVLVIAIFLLSLAYVNSISWNTALILSFDMLLVNICLGFLSSWVGFGLLCCWHVKLWCETLITLLSCCLFILTWTVTCGDINKCWLSGQRLKIHTKGPD